MNITYINEPLNIPRLKRLVKYKFDECLSKCVFRMNDENFRAFDSFRRDFTKAIEKKLSLYKLNKNLGILETINYFCNEFANVVDDFSKSISVCTSGILIRDMQNVLLKKFNKILIEFTE